MSSNLQKATINELLPSSVKDDEVISNLSKALSSELQNITNNINQILFYPNIKQLPETIIDLLAEQFQVNFYDILGLDLEVKRELVQNSMLWNKKKGTKAVMQQMISTLYNSNCTIKEWFEYDGEPYHFKLFIDNVSFKKEDLDNITYIINELKNVRSHLESIAINMIVKSNLYCGGVVIKRSKRVVKANMTKWFPNTIYVGSVVIRRRKTIIKGSEIYE